MGYRAHWQNKKLRLGICKALVRAPQTNRDQCLKRCFVREPERAPHRDWNVGLVPTRAGGSVRHGPNSGEPPANLVDRSRTVPGPQRRPKLRIAGRKLRSQLLSFHNTRKRSTRLSFIGQRTAWNGRSAPKIQPAPCGGRSQMAPLG